MNKLLDIIDEKEKERIRKLKYYEYEAYKEGYQFVAGIDEVGRGTLAGPVAAAAVILPVDFELAEVNDSKLLTAKKRQKLAGQIKKAAIDWAIAMVSPEYIDRYNILKATREAMKMAAQALTPSPDFLLIDAVELPDLTIRQFSLIKGDQSSISIACASIIAKVARDTCMCNFDAIYPGYGFAKHKGYATKEHQKQLKNKGACFIHRQSFRPVKYVLQGGRNEEQLCLFK